MPVIKSVRGIHLVFGKNCFLAENAVVVGEVTMGDRCSIWFNTVVRGDVYSISIGNETNIQDGAVIHCTYQRSKTVIGDQVSIAHNAIVHACTIQDRVPLLSRDVFMVVSRPKKSRKSARNCKEFLNALPAIM